jgi:hypothetical protein
LNVFQNPIYPDIEAVHYLNIFLRKKNQPIMTEMANDSKPTI